MRPIVNDTFELKATNAGVWALQARRLKRAADILFARIKSATELEERELYIPASLLYGLAIEIVFKGIFIQKTKPTAQELVKHLDGKNAHNLKHWADKVSFPLSRDEIDLLTRLSAFVEWAGRYPVPKKVERMAIKQKAVTGAYPPLPLQLHEASLYEDLFARAEKIVARYAR